MSSSSPGDVEQVSAVREGIPLLSGALGHFNKSALRAGFSPSSPAWWSVAGVELAQWPR